MDNPAACAATRYANQLHATVERLAIGRRWPLVLSDGNVHLPIGRGIGALLVRAGIGGRVGAGLPALALSAGLWAFLVDTADAGTPALPPHVRLMTDGQYLPLPPSVTADGPVRWIREPDARLPRLATALGLLGPFTPAVTVRR
ncbi:hypothetical protein FHX81_0747 [Saccharothrix saharensis]|uniref:Uncharacterized protein n=1 Tax=Saccharothrix saharensis TaxID=571190 RepID=A0A543J6R6_9PSEU|nr:hypothetical protein [Saccharothrix saharensis]TQM78478.1 hypothetical protein FHX81_0747 [Saccharothrix saharensis]